MNAINKWGAVAASISAILALVALVLIKPLMTLKKKRDAERAEAAEFRRKVLTKLDGIEDDIADLQYERLSQAHDFYTQRGWCPTSKKQQLCNMYQSYSAKGRNHLSAHYETEILNLKDEP